MVGVNPVRLESARLVLRPSCDLDFSRAFEIRENWNVARYLSGASFPPDPEFMRQWMAGHEQEWQAGTAFRFAVEHEDRVIGIVDVSDISNGEGELGYWLDEQCWGHGFGYEAAERVVRFSFEDIELRRITAGHTIDNTRSKRVLEKLGFVSVGEVSVFSEPRGTEITQCRLELTRPRYVELRRPSRQMSAN